MARPRLPLLPRVTPHLDLLPDASNAEPCWPWSGPLLTRPPRGAIKADGTPRLLARYKTHVLQRANDAGGVTTTTHREFRGLRLRTQPSEITLPLVSYNGRSVPVQRALYEEFRCAGEPSQHPLRRICTNPRCVNPWHREEQVPPASATPTPEPTPAPIPAPDDEHEELVELLEQFALKSPTWDQIAEHFGFAGYTPDQVIAAMRECRDRDAFTPFTRRTLPA